MIDYRLYDMPMSPAVAPPRVPASVGLGGWILIVLVAALVAAGVAFTFLRARAAMAEAQRAAQEAERAAREAAEARQRAERDRQWAERHAPAGPTVRWVEMTAIEGTIALAENTEANRELAYEMCNRKWGIGNYVIVWEKEVPVGTTPAPGENRSLRERVPQRVETEYHIHFAQK